MRFSRLLLKRYGHFEDCELGFRAGTPDLHVIYGANEAGKSTTLSAVSDLLFGFEHRVSYHFRFDHRLLRVGAVLEDGAETLLCLRKRGNSGTLLDEEDRPIDETPLLAMLKGQTRKTFDLSFSLNQETLRAGGKAIVEAKDDLGRTLFAAGSGLTGIAATLDALDEETRTIWAPPPAKRPVFVQLQQAFNENAKTARDATLKPRVWTEAKNSEARNLATLDETRQRHGRLAAELRGLERGRRIAPLARQRTRLLEDAEAYRMTPDIGAHNEDAAELAMRDAEAAERDKAAAEQLLNEVARDIEQLVADPDVLAEAQEIDTLSSEAGADEKAARDLVGIDDEHRAVEADIARLRDEIGEDAEASLSRTAIGALRELLGRQGENASALRQIGENEDALEESRSRAIAKLEQSGASETDYALFGAIDDARALGADADARCDNAGRRVESSATSLAGALARLTPWSGDIEALRALPRVSVAEIEEIRSDLADLAAEIRRAEDDARRAGDAADASSLEIEGLGGESAVSSDEIATVRHEREERWQPLREHILSDVPLPSPAAAVSEFEASVTRADMTTDRRFDFADASSRLAILEGSLASQRLSARQADERARSAGERHADVLARWRDRLRFFGLPALEPTRFKGWQDERETVERDHSDHVALAADAADIVARRDEKRSTLVAVLGSVEVAGNGLAPVLAIAERRRKVLENRARERQLAESALKNLDADAELIAGRREKLDREAGAIAAEWSRLVEESGLSLQLAGAGAILDLIDELREATRREAELRRRVDGINRDARDYALRIERLAEKLGMPDAAGNAARLRALRDRLSRARSAADLLQSHNGRRDQHQSAANEAQAKLKAAEDSLAPMMAETGSASRAELGEAIARSRARRQLVEAVAETERNIVAQGDGLALDDLLAAVAGADPDELAGRVDALNAELAELNDEVAKAATDHGDARRVLIDLEAETAIAANAASDAEQARSELAVLAEQYILKRVQTVTLKWAIERYRERHQDPMLLRASELFAMLTVGRYASLRVDGDGDKPRLFGLRDDGHTLVEIDGMSEGTTDQLFLALRLAALEQSAAVGVNLPFLADDLFVNFDNERSEAGFRVLAEIARTTQILFFTHHPHLAAIARQVVGADIHSECTLA